MMTECDIPLLDLPQSPISKPGSPYQYQAPTSLWKLVEQVVPGPEKQEIRNMLSVSLVEESIQLHNEVQLLLEILQDYRQEKLSLTTSKLPEPPQVREILIKEISFFVVSIQEKLAYKGINSSKVLSKYNQNILDYVSHQNEVSQESFRSLSSLDLTSDGEQVSSPSTDRSSLGSAVSDEIQDMCQSLNFLQVDDVAQHLRSRLKIEIEQLLTDIEFLQNCLDEAEHFTLVKSVSNPCNALPTLSELRQERTLLEKELLKESDNNEMLNSIHQGYPTSRKLISPLEACQQKRVQSCPPYKKYSSAHDYHTKNIREQKFKSVNESSSSLTQNIHSDLSQYKFIPRPPTQGKPRAHSAEKFRRMVYYFRESDTH